MKRYLTIFLAVCILFVSAPAFAAQGDATLLRAGNDGDGLSVYNLVCLNDTLYFRTYDREIYAFDLNGANEWKKYSIDVDIYTDNRYFSIEAMAVDGENLYALGIEQVNDSDESTVKGASLYKLELDGETARLVDGLELEWDDMIESYDEYEYSRNCSTAFIQDGQLIITTYSTSGSGMDLFMFDMETGEATNVFVDNLRYTCAYQPGSVLVETFDYEAEKKVVYFDALDLDTEELTPIAKIAMDDYYLPFGLAYDADSDSLYYIHSGELFALPGMSAQNAVAVAAISTDNSDMTPVLTRDGYYIAYDYQTIVKRNTDPSARAQTRLSVVNSYNRCIEDAYFAFTNAHPETEVVLKPYQSDVITAMMNRNTDIDVFSMSVSASDYAALFERGYMAELTGNQEITEFVKGMYPNLSGALVKDGEVLAVPVSFDASGYGYNPKALEKIGLTEEDLPTTWAEFFILLQRMPDILGEDSEVSAVEPYYTANDMRSELFYSLFNSYMQYVMNEDASNISFDTPLLNEVLDEFEKVDFVALGLPEDDIDRHTMYSYNSDGILFNSYSNISAYNRYYERTTPMPLALGAGLQPSINASMEVVFVNPYSANRDLAVEYVSLVAASIDGITKIHLNPAYADPIRNDSYESVLESYQEQIDSLKEQLEKADDSEKAYYEQMIKEGEEYAAEYRESGSWTVTEESIAFYQKYVPYCQVNRSFNMSKENSQDFYSAIGQYLSGTSDRATMLRAIDKKMKMMLMEGN